MFSIGLTILEAGSLEDCSEIYGYSSDYRFSEGILQSFINIFENRYSRELTILVKEML